MRRKRPAPVTDTLIGRGTTVEGRIECDAGLRIEGEFTGEIVCRGDVVIGESGVVRSNVTARGVTVAGKLYGSVTAHGRFTLLRTGEMHGDVAAAGYVIEGGAKLNADCRTDPSLAEEPRNGGLKQPASSNAKPPHVSAAEAAGAAGALPASAVSRDARLAAPQAKKQAG
ncbi:MAG: hypothetical protein A9Z00_09080 [Thermobacillus sp. ZCTH02-B1]|uniref:bactofilin family protein n=1 Tax=Thermobacillus sp. ZCTH02-B1 TaxID=1858795 RepID=UPI000B55AA4D|nr:polymer-forming cytoskeletal protein [Thermobacillus sp. ZCTH02-B1]OUM94842.1 MAG: hypothetical protein A9Z00_09080 [Thermobacillus sp. ZCTH02-B1]